MRVLALVIATAALTASPGTSIQHQQAPDKSDTISGQVMAIVSESVSRPVRRARVVLEAPDGTTVVATTDTGGVFHFDSLRPGKYRLRAQKAGFAPAATNGAIWMSIPAAHQISQVYEMIPAAAIEGRVVDEGGQPLEQITISAVIASDVAGHAAHLSMRVVTDSFGRFRLHTLPPGTYYVVAQQQRAQGAGATDSPPANGVYYPNAQRLGDARAFTLGQGEEAQNIDFVLPTAMSSTLDRSSRVTLDPGRIDAGRAADLTGVVRGHVAAAESGHPISRASVILTSDETGMVTWDLSGLGRPL